MYIKKLFCKNVVASDRDKSRLKTVFLPYFSSSLAYIYFSFFALFCEIISSAVGEWSLCVYNRMPTYDDQKIIASQSWRHKNMLNPFLYINFYLFL